MNTEYFQQGDCLLKHIKLPETSKVLDTDLLHKGENHHHRLRGQFQIMEAENARFLRSNGCELYHEEHKTIAIPEGTYALSFVQEYDHWLEESRAVID